VCNSAMVADDIAQRFGVAREKLHVIYNAVDTQRFSSKLREFHRARLRYQLGIPIGVENAFVFLLVGSGFSRKGVSRAINALSLLDPYAHLVVVGDDKKREQFEEHAISLGLMSHTTNPKRVHFVGTQTPVDAWYGMADAFVLPTLYDPCPNAGFEAMAAGLPIVTSTQCGIAELLLRPSQGTVGGFACDNLDASQLPQLMSKVMTDTYRMGQAARALVAPFTQHAMAAQYTALYKKLTA
jgi:UDP-glucose:(heptosyl)LPS alpha-1,3-glucosyltransferase